MKKAIYAGSFDPITKGHLWMIEEGSKLFDKLIVSIGTNPQKKYTFSLDERVRMLERTTSNLPNVDVQTFENKFLVTYADSEDAQYVLRGIRNQDDYEYEKGMRNINSDLNPNISTVFLMPPREISEISSSLVKELIGPEGWENIIGNYVSREVHNQFLIKFGGLKKRWTRLWNKIGAESSGKKEYNELVSLYGKNNRAYHNFVHILDSLGELDKLEGKVKNSHKLEVALWYHDAIYNPSSKNNEEESAKLAGRRLLDSNLDEKFVREIKEMILATKHTDKPKNLNEKYIVDIDLSGLGISQEKYDKYERDIRFEYSWVPKKEFRKRRKEILQKFLDRKQIYSTEFFRKIYEKQARENLKRSIKNLEQNDL